MTGRHPFAWAAVVIAGSALLPGCKQEWSLHRAPDGYGVVRDRVAPAPSATPPVNSWLDLTITGVDNAPVVREKLPPLVDLPPGVLVPEGEHRFDVEARPHFGAATYLPLELSFVATVESGKIYFLVDNTGGPKLVEEGAKPR